MVLSPILFLYEYYTVKIKYGNAVLDEENLRSSLQIFRNDKKLPLFGLLILTRAVF